MGQWACWCDWGVIAPADGRMACPGGCAGKRKNGKGELQLDATYYEEAGKIVDDQGNVLEGNVA